jgi:peptidoglycan/LPS O-acetylase OafA/YrhL
MAGPPRRVPALDGLRGLAILAVLAWHYIAAITPWDPAWARSARALLAYAWTGVDLFFVLSGFLIGGIVLEQRRAPNFLAVFYARRALRILPLYWLVLAAFAASGALLAGHLAEPAREWLHGNPHSAFTYLTFGQNFATGLFTPEVAEPGWVNVTWSLAVEEHFYLVGPLALWLLPARAIPWALAAGVAAGPLVRWLVVSRIGEASVYVLTPCRVDAIVLGVLCAWALRQPRFRAALRRRTLYLAAALLAGALLAAEHVDLGRGYQVAIYSVTALLYACVLLLAIVEERGPVAAVLRSRALQRVGLLAYGLYLLHQPVNGLLHGLLAGAAPSIATLAGGALTAAALVVTFALAELSWRFVEQPLVAVGQRLRYGATPVPEAAARRRPAPPAATGRPPRARRRIAAGRAAPASSRGFPPTGAR